MKTLVVTLVLSCYALFAHAQSMATDAKITTDKNGVQCASTGIGRGANNAEAKENAAKNREAAEKSARESKSGEGRASVGRGSGEAKCDRPRGKNTK